MRRSQKLKACQECLGCLLRQDPNGLCHRGTNSGDCIPCGRIKSKYVPSSFGGFFNRDLGEYLLSLARTPAYLLFSSDENYVEICLSSPNGTFDYNRCLTEYELRTRDPAVKRHFDDMVSKYCVPNLPPRTTTTTFIKSAWMGRGYLALLLACRVERDAESFHNNIRLFNLIVTRLDEIIFEVVNGFEGEKRLGDEKYWLELSISLAILYFGLLHAQECLMNHAIQPICGDENLPRLLAHRIRLTLDTFKLLLCHQCLSCDPGWLAIFNGSLEDLRSSLNIPSLRVRTIKPPGLMSTRSSSESSYGSASIGVSYTPPSSIEATPPADICAVNLDAKTESGGFDDGSRLSFSPFIEVPPLPRNQFQAFKIYKFLEPPPEPPPSIFREHNSIPPPIAVPHGTENNLLRFSTFPEIHTSPDHGFEDFESSEPNGVQASKVEQTPDHVPFSSPDISGFEEETSVLEFRDLFPDLHHTLLDDEEKLAKNPIHSFPFVTERLFQQTLTKPGWISNGLYE